MQMPDIKGKISNKRREREMGGKHDWLKLQFAFEVEMQMPDIKGKISKGVGQNDGQKLQFASEVEMQMPEI